MKETRTYFTSFVPSYRRTDFHYLLIINLFYSEVDKRYGYTPIQGIHIITMLAICYCINHDVCVYHAISRLYTHTEVHHWTSKEVSLMTLHHNFCCSSFTRNQRNSGVRVYFDLVQNTVPGYSFNWLLHFSRRFDSIYRSLENQIPRYLKTTLRDDKNAIETLNVQHPMGF